MQKLCRQRWQINKRSKAVILSLSLSAGTFAISREKARRSEKKESQILREISRENFCDFLDAFDSRVSSFIWLCFLSNALSFFFPLSLCLWRPFLRGVVLVGVRARVSGKGIFYDFNFIFLFFQLCVFLILVSGFVWDWGWVCGGVD